MPVFINRLDCIYYDGRESKYIDDGEDVAKGLGQRTILMKSFVLLIIVLLSGGSVAVAQLDLLESLPRTFPDFLLE